MALAVLIIADCRFPIADWFSALLAWVRISSCNGTGSAREARNWQLAIDNRQGLKENPMKIYFHGATGDVTGSAYHVVTKHASILVDCGMFQGGKKEKAKNRNAAKLEGGKLDAVVITHGHLDHVGRLPILTRKGYEGPIYATKQTFEIARLVLRDSLMLEKADLKREN